MENQELIAELHKIGGIKFGEYKLKSGILSPVYIDLRILVSYPKTMKKIAKAYVKILEHLDYDRMAAVPYAAMPIVAAISAINERPWIFTRKEVKDYGTKKNIEGEYKAGETVVVVDDMTTNGASKLEVIAPFEKDGLVVKDVVVLLDREQGAQQNLAAKGYTLHSVLTLSEALKTLRNQNTIDEAMFQKVTKFLAESKP